MEANLQIEWLFGIWMHILLCFRLKTLWIRRLFASTVCGQSTKVSLCFRVVILQMSQLCFRIVMEKVKLLICNSGGLSFGFNCIFAWDTSQGNERRCCKCSGRWFGYLEGGWYTSGWCELGWGKCIRMRVKVDISQPLMRGKVLKLGKSELLWVTL